MDVGVTKNREVLVFLNVGLLHLEDAEAFAQSSVPLSIHFKLAKKCQPTSLHLVLVAVNAGRSKTVGPQVLPGLVLVGSAVVTPAQKVRIEAQ